MYALTRAFKPEARDGCHIPRRAQAQKDRGSANPRFGRKGKGKTLKSEIGGVKIVKMKIFLLKRLISREKGTKRAARPSGGNKKTHERLERLQL